MDKCTEIHMWFEETNAKLQQKWLPIKAKNNRAKCESKDELSKRNIELAREVKMLNEENKVLHEENKELRFENEELRQEKQTILRKIKELVNDYQSTN